MKRFSAGLSLGIGLAGLVGVGTLARAENPDQVRQLLQTNTCENCDLQGANLMGLDLTEADLRGANLQGAQLTHSVLMRADLTGADLRGATLTAVDLRGASLQNANLSAALLDNFCGEGGLDLAAAECQMFNLLHLLGPDLCDRESYGLAVWSERETSLDQLCPQEVTDGGWFQLGYWFSDLGRLLQGVSLMGADLRGANLSGLNLEGADLRYAQLDNADLSDTRLRYALLFEATFAPAQNVDFDQAYRTKADVGRILELLLQEQGVSSGEADGYTDVGTLNRAQQAYYLEHATFAPTLADLDLGFEPENSFYRYEVAVITERSVVNSAIAQQVGFKSYLGIVYGLPTGLDLAVTVATVCETESWPETLPAIPPGPANAAAEVSCPAGFVPSEP